MASWCRRRLHRLTRPHPPRSFGGSTVAFAYASSVANFGFPLSALLPEAAPQGGLAVTVNVGPQTAQAPYDVQSFWALLAPQPVWSRTRHHSSGPSRRRRRRRSLEATRCARQPRRPIRPWQRVPFSRLYGRTTSLRTPRKPRRRGQLTPRVGPRQEPLSAQAPRRTKSTSVAFWLEPFWLKRCSSGQWVRAPRPPCDSAVRKPFSAPTLRAAMPNGNKKASLLLQPAPFSDPQSPWKVVAWKREKQGKRSTTKEGITAAPPPGEASIARRAVGKTPPPVRYQTLHHTPVSGQPCGEDWCAASSAEEDGGHEYGGPHLGPCNAGLPRRPHQALPRCHRGDVGSRQGDGRQNEDVGPDPFLQA